MAASEAQPQNSPALEYRCPARAAMASVGMPESDPPSVSALTASCRTRMQSRAFLPPCLASFAYEWAQVSKASSLPKLSSS